ncbi:MAG: DedA family protein [Fimbriimonas sp.]
MSSWIVDAVSSTGYFGIALLMFIENLIPPIPSEMIVPLGGYLASQGKLSLPLVIVAGTAGSVAGQAFLYFLARKLGEERVRDWVDRHGRWVAISGDEVDRATKWFHDRGGWAVMLGRLVPGVRSLISVPAGLGKMALPAFLAYTTVGTAVWTAALAFLGLWLGSRFQEVDRYLDFATWGILGLAAAVYLYRVATYDAPKKASSSTKLASSRLEA